MHAEALRQLEDGVVERDGDLRVLGEGGLGER